MENPEILEGQLDRIVKGLVVQLWGMNLGGAAARRFIREAFDQAIAAAQPIRSDESDMTIPQAPALEDQVAALEDQVMKLEDQVEDLGIRVNWICKQLAEAAKILR